MSGNTPNISPLISPSSWSKSRHATLRPVMVFCLDSLVFKWTKGPDCGCVSYVDICVCRSVHLHSGICVLNRDGESCSQTERLTHPDEERQAEGEWRGGTMGRVTDQDTSIIICILAAASEFNIASLSLWWLATVVYWISAYFCLCGSVCLTDRDRNIKRKGTLSHCLCSLQMGLHIHTQVDVFVSVCHRVCSIKAFL